MRALMASLLIGLNEVNGKLVLDKELYPVNIIERARADYSQLASTKIEESASAWLVSFENCVYDNETTMNEFGNYLLSLMHTRSNG